MQHDPHTIGPDDTIEDAATVMHTKDVSRLPVVDDDGQMNGSLNECKEANNATEHLLVCVQPN